MKRNFHKSKWKAIINQLIKLTSLLIEMDWLHLQFSIIYIKHSRQQLRSSARRKHSSVLLHFMRSRSLFKVYQEEWVFSLFHDSMLWIHVCLDKHGNMPSLTDTCRACKSKASFHETNRKLSTRHQMFFEIHIK